MREKWAKLVVVFTGLLVLLFAYLFADSQNPIDHSVDTEEKPWIKESTRFETGKQLFKEQQCAACHSIAGIGNPRSRLDKVGTKLKAKELRDWIIGAESVQEQLPPHVLRMKQEYKNMPKDQLNSLVYYLQNLK